MTREDQRLIEGLIQGKESDWQALFASHYPFMCYLADQYVHDEYLAAALASDVFSHLWEIRKTVHIDRSLRSYLLRATRNRCLNYLQSAAERREEGFSRNDPFLSAFDETHPLGILLEKELEQQLASVLARLPEQTRRVFAKSRLEGLSYQQIADQMGITPHTVKYHIRQALTLLRSEFAKYLGLFLIFLSTSLP